MSYSFVARFDTVELPLAELLSRLKVALHEQEIDFAGSVTQLIEHKKWPTPIDFRDPMDLQGTPVDSIEEIAPVARRWWGVSLVLVGAHVGVGGTAAPRSLEVDAHAAVPGNGRATVRGMDPWAELLEHVERGEVPLAWIERHAPDGDLRPHWEACTDAPAMLRLAMQLGDPSAGVRAACACVRTSLQFAIAGDARTAQAVEAAEGCVDGRLSPEQCAVASRAACFAALDAGRRYSAQHAAVAAAAVAGAAAGYLPEAVEAVERVAAAHAASIAEPDNDPCRWDAGYARALAELAEVVRAHVPCPSFQALIAAVKR